MTTETRPAGRFTGPSAVWVLRALVVGLAVALVIAVVSRPHATKPQPATVPTPEEQYARMCADGQAWTYSANAWEVAVAQVLIDDGKIGSADYPTGEPWFQNGRIIPSLAVQPKTTFYGWAGRGGPAAALEPYEVLGEQAVTALCPQTTPTTGATKP